MSAFGEHGEFHQSRKMATSITPGGKYRRLKLRASPSHFHIIKSKSNV